MGGVARRWLTLGSSFILSRDLLFTFHSDLLLTMRLSTGVAAAAW